MKKLKYILAAIAATFIAPFAACGKPADNSKDELKQIQEEVHTEAPQGPNNNDVDQVQTLPGDGGAQPQEEGKPKAVMYFAVTADGVNIRSGAGTGYSVLGQAEKSTLYSSLGDFDGWYCTSYHNKTAYISSKYCTLVNMPSSPNEQIEAVIAEGCKLLGTPYVYGAVRLHDGKGNFYKSFTTDKFDCSSLMQYIFYKGANKLIDVNTRTQVYQGTTVSRSQLKRGDLMFFTNAQRKYNNGVERIGHVALYLGDNYILHTASDYAKIEQISATRWSYFIQGQRIL